MKQKYFIFRTEDGYDWTTDENELNGKEVLIEDESSEGFVKLMAGKQIVKLKIQDGNFEDLPEEFIGTGEVKGFKFVRCFKNDEFYIYCVDGMYYEIFDKKYRGNKVKYPKAEDFGDWAWTFQKASNVIKFVRGHYRETIDPAVLEV